MTDPTGAITLAQSYDPYGVVTSTVKSPDVSTQFGYTSEAADTSELTYLRARYYNPADGRFLSRDPSGMENNLFLYARSNPINNTDPSGLFSKSDIGFTYYPLAGSQTSGDYWFRRLLDEREADTRFDSHAQWGLYAALLDAESGDRLETFRLNLFPGFAPSFVQVDNFSLSLGTGFIPTRNRINFTDLNNRLPGTANLDHRDTTARYYVLHSKNGAKTYVDGSHSTDYPDFMINNLMGSVPSDVTKAILTKYVGEKLVGLIGRTAFDCISLFSYSRGYITDRYGNKYIIDTIGWGPSASVLTFGEGYLQNGGQIRGSETLKSAMVGLSLGPSISFLHGVSGSISLSGGPSAAVYSVGLQGGGAVEGSKILYTGETDSSLGWQYAIDIEDDLLMADQVIFKEDLLSR